MCAHFKKMLAPGRICHSLWLTLLFASCVFSNDETIYCDRTESQTVISNVSSGIIETLYPGSSYYGNDMDCSWVIDAGIGENRGISVIVEKTHLQWAPSGAICQGYDYMEIRQGQGPNRDEQDRRPGWESQANDVIVTFCGEMNPHQVISSGRYLYLRFVSNDRNQGNFGGVRLNFTVFTTSPQLGACPPMFHDDPSLPQGGADCFSVSSHRKTWTQAQQYCRYLQANLADLDDEGQGDLVTDIISRTDGILSYDNVWIGLNDVEVEGDYRWINGSKHSGFQRWRDNPHVSDTFLNCVCMQSHDGLWKEDFCNENSIHTEARYYFVCKKKKVDSTELYQIPSVRIEKDNKGYSAPIPWIVLGVIGAILLLAGVVAMVFFAVRGNRIKHQLRASSTRGNMGSSQEQSTMALQGSGQGPPQYDSRNQMPDEPPPPYQKAVQHTSL